MKSSKYFLVTNLQLFLMATWIAVLSSLLVSVNSWYQDLRLLPEVHVDAAGTCIKVMNRENGHAFNCQDVDVLLRRYHVVRTP